MKQQPDLNWRNPAVKQAMWDAVRFWLDLGVDGFRLDALGTIFEDPALTPHTAPMTLAELRRFSETAATPEEKAMEEKLWREMFQHQWGGPGLHDLMKELRAILDAYPAIACWWVRTTTSPTWGTGPTSCTWCSTSR